jgi:hypothetical protein
LLRSTVKRSGGSRAWEPKRVTDGSPWQIHAMALSGTDRRATRRLQAGGGSVSTGGREPRIKSRLIAPVVARRLRKSS